ncbi:MAG: DUF1592 domain-containing protein [Planctomycetota bacterium]|nr:DUF1592 domain-containing protein [Planctomycetota bacterium]
MQTWVNRENVKPGARKLAALLIASCCIFAGAEMPAQGFKADVAPLVKASCIKCHDGDTKTRLDFGPLGYELSDPATFRKWELVFDRVDSDEMPPKGKTRPSPRLRRKALASLKRDLLKENLSRQRREGRVPARRLTRLEYEYTMHDLLLVREDLAKILPAESDSGGFDTVGAGQGISPIHIRSYLEAADYAIDAAINLRSRPKGKPQLVDYLNSRYVNMWHDRELRRGGSVTRKLKDAVAVFVDQDYILKSNASGLNIRSPGLYRIKVEAYTYQSRKPLILTIIHTSEKGGGSQLLGAFDLIPGEPRTVEVTALMRPGDYIYPSVAGLTHPKGIYIVGSQKYKGEGVAMKSMHVEGPLFESWPPQSTRRLLGDVEYKEVNWFRSRESAGPDGYRSFYEVELKRKPLEQVARIVNRLAPLAFRRPPREGEVEALISLARPALEAGRKFTDVIRVPLRALFSTPAFLFHGGAPGKLDDFALATRLSYFLWKSLPDEKLFELAKAGQLSDPKVLAAQVDRMLDDEKSMRFVEDFLGQWLRLREINATTPDEKLYPEFDEILGQSMRQETELFFASLIKENLGVGNLLDSDFTFLNRPLANHYGIKGVAGQHFRKVKIPPASPRGGLLTQASVLKITANGTVTSPVMRGNFVLTNLLGTPPDPPPPTAGTVEPDTRGTTTIREILAAHRDEETCNRCHREIDPPGFALESFDPIGGFRTRYRSTRTNGGVFSKIFPGKGRKVDASGVTAEGKAFSGILEYKELLLEREDQVARHLISQLLVYATGAEIQFADRENVELLAEEVGRKDYPVRTIIHKVVQSKLFRNK